jgi:hypothetical protein
MHRRSRVFSALPLPMHAASTVTDPMTSRTALSGAVLSIEGARTHAHGISTGAVAVFRAFQRAQPGVDRSRGIVALCNAPTICPDLGSSPHLIMLMFRLVLVHMVRVQSCYY